MYCGLKKLLMVCERYANLGSAVTDQLSAVVNGEPFAEQNPNALNMIKGFLSNVVSADLNGNITDEAKGYKDMITDFLENDLDVE